MFDAPPGIAVAVIFVVCFLAYANSLNGRFVFDDTVIIQDNPAIRALDSEHLAQVFGGHYWKAVEAQGGLYRPVVLLSFAANYALGGEDPRGYHLFNLVVHGLNGILLYFIIRALFGRADLSLLSALLFVLHPIRTEGVASIVGRAESLSAFFVLAAWCSYLKGRAGSWRWLSLSAAAFFLGTLTKENAFSFLALLPLTDLLVPPAAAGRRFEPASTARRYLPFVLVSALSLGIRYLVLGGLAPLYINPSSNPMAGADPWTRFLTATHVFGRYLWLMILPVKLSADYSYNQIPLVSDPLSWRAVIPFIALLLLVLGAGRALRKSPFLFFCGYVFFATFVLVSNWLRPIGTLMSERLMYLPSVGFTCALAYLLVRGLERPRSKVPAGLLSVLILAVYAVRTLERNQDWRDHYRLFKSAVEVSPESSLVQANYAAILLGERNDPHGASKHAQKAIAIYPADPSAHFTLAEACRVTGDLERAVRAYSEVVALAPRTSGGTSALRSLARVHEQLGNIGAAIGDYETLIEWRPSELDAYLGAARLHASMGRHSRAREILVRARAVAPGHPEIENLWTLLKPE